MQLEYRFSTNALNSSSACPKITPPPKRIKGFLALLINQLPYFSMFKVGFGLLLIFVHFL
jgi:hypothetical protein